MKPTEEWLRQKYEAEGLDCPTIGIIVARDPKTVWTWLKSYGIATRPRGFNNRFVHGQVSQFKGKKHTDESKARFRAARLADGHFPKQRDGRPYWAGKSGKAHPTWAGGATPERQAFYGTHEWADARKLAYTTAHGLCQRCGTKNSLHVHHVIPFVIKRTRAAAWNLRVLCDVCHRFVHSNQNTDREYLPVFGMLPTDGGMVRINYWPKHKGSLPLWMR